MGLLTKEIIRKNGKKVKVEDLTKNSHALVDVKCDGCEKILKPMTWQSYKTCVKDDGKYYCNLCAIAGYRKWTSFYEWCYENLSKEEVDKIMLRWDYEKNIDNDGNKINPKDITPNSIGFNKKGYWFKCLDHPEHESEQKYITSFVKGQKGSLNCNQCNMIAITRPDLVKYLVNKDDAIKYSKNSLKNIFVKCPNCGYKKSTKIVDLSNHGFSCSRCSDGVPYTEKFMFNILEQLNINFKFQLSKTIFKWCNGYKYDFYIEKINGIIETHGLQHYEEVKDWKMSLNEIQQNDYNKEQLAKENEIKNYIIIDCRKSELEWIKNSIIESELPKLLNFKESDIDWLKAHEAGCKNLVKEVCDLWNNGLNSTLIIVNKLKISRSTVVRYLHQGAKLGWCNYNTKRKEIICLTTGEVFQNISEAINKYNIDGIGKCCINSLKSAGKHPKTGESMIWMYYDEYILKNENEIKHILNNIQDKKIICITTEEIFIRISDASNKYNIASTTISACCKGKLKSAGKHPKTHNKMIWMYYEDYILKNAS